MSACLNICDRSFDNPVIDEYPKGIYIVWVTDIVNAYPTPKVCSTIVVDITLDITGKESSLGISVTHIFNIWGICDIETK